jgi:predicted porin
MPTRSAPDLIARLTLALVALEPAGALAQALPKLETMLGGGTTVRLYGQINQGVLVHDDGGETNSYALVDNSNSSSRLGLRTETPLDGGVAFRTNLEAQYTPNPSSKVSQTNSFVGDWDLEWTNLRKAEMILASEAYGTVSLGQGSMATDGIAEIDFSGTSLIAYSQIPDLAGGQFFRFDGGALSGVTIGKVFSNFDGSRRLRARYDTPSFAGFTLSGAYGQEVLTSGDDKDYVDLALRWAESFDTVKVSAGVGYNWKGGGSEAIAASASALHAPTGLNLTLAAGGDSQGGDGRYVYGKLGVIRDVFAFGSTAVSLDANFGADIGLDGGDSASYALAAVQRIDDWSLEAYGIIRNHSFDDAAASYDDGLSFMTGLRFSF